ncbi:ShlB/FhaC/HecB family hemolysin secretion/activation protein [Pseudomonas rhizoryzae]|uniref:ShlB/FhaC/HecB family hemolysin secretion/activation protein n=1 Tax=Pseudomonas rhizoryzae TaxID=2571129 RepID=UPI000736D229|nr:ShlB/FhaC/HecB family hemolysin secretion/activation protein [Pseudomonas rhizoryzae]KTT35593.1 membrane protein [Pseudomonas psychrotolerans]KTT71723.1 membrane protein [Pseudomonas psychrotolerans]
MRLIHPLLGCVLAALPYAVHAATAPDAGQSLQSLDQQPLALPERQTLELNLPSAPATQAASGGPTLVVKGFILEGNSAFPDQELQQLLKDLRGRSLTLAQLQAGLQRITELYQAHGYPLARAYLPAQSIDDGQVRVAILEGRYGAVRAEHAVDLHGFALAPLAQLVPGEPIKADSLTRSLLLLQEVPGRDAKATLQPGATTGTSDLVVDMGPATLWSGSVDADNYGNRFIGEYRLGGTLNVNNPLALGDRLSLRATVSDEDQRYGRIAYQLPVTPWSTQLGVAYSDMDYRLAKDFADLDAHGRAQVASVFAVQPLIRQRGLTLDTQLQFDAKRLRDDIDAFSERSDKHSRVTTLSLNGSSQDSLLGGGVNSFALAWSHGDLDISGADQRLQDQTTAGTRGQFNKLSPSLVRLQRLTERFSLYTQLQAQWADRNLDSSEKFYLGGAYGVRAYPQGEASGDEGWLANVELRYALTQAWQLSTFVDHGEVRLNRDPWTTEDNHRSLSGAGVGATWNAYGWRVNAVAAWKLGNAEPTSDVDRSPRVWAQVVRFF